jgi:hypothetical protein
LIDRAIGIFGIALAIATSVLQNYFPELPSWVPPAGFALAIFLFGLSIGLVAAGGLRRRRAICQKASLKLHVYGDHRTPERLSFENIFRWFYHQATFDGVGPAGTTRLAAVTTLVVSFEEDTAITTLKVRSPDMQLPLYEVKEFNQRFAVIVFGSTVPAGTLEIEVSP